MNQNNYINRILEIPSLSEKEEKYLLSIKDCKAIQQLIMSHLKYVVKIASSYRGYGLDLEDLIQEGSVGLSEAVHRFDNTKNVRLATYAVYWIKREIHEYIIKNWKIVKVATTKPQRKLFFKLRSLKQNLDWSTSAELTKIANELDVETSDVSTMEQRLITNDVAFDPVDSEEYTPSYFLDGNTESPESLVISSDKKVKIYQALDNLSDRDKEIIIKRWLSEDQIHLSELGKHYGVSKERVRQLEARAIKTLKQNMEQYND